MKGSTFLIGEERAMKWTRSLSGCAVLLATVLIGASLAYEALRSLNPQALGIIGHTDTVYALAFDPDGRLLSTASADGTIRLWDVPRCRQLAVLRGHRGAVLTVAFAPDRRRLVSGGEDGTIRLWEPSNGAAIGILATDLGRVESLAFAPDGQTLATASGDQTVRLWNFDTRQEQYRLDLRPLQDVPHLAFAPDGEWLATADKAGGIRLWDAATGHFLRCVRSPRDPMNGIQTVTVAPDSRFLISVGDDRTVHFWNAGSEDEGFHPSCRSPFETKEVIHIGEITALAYSPDGRLLATGGDGVVKVWDVWNNRQLVTLGVYDLRPCTPVAFSPDGRWLATTFGGKSVFLQPVHPRWPNNPFLPDRSKIEVVAVRESNAWMTIPPAEIEVRTVPVSAARGAMTKACFARYVSKTIVKHPPPKNRVLNESDLYDKRDDKFGSWLHGVDKAMLILVEPGDLPRPGQRVDIEATSIQRTPGGTRFFTQTILRGLEVLPGEGEVPEVEGETVTFPDGRTIRSAHEPVGKPSAQTPARVRALAKCLEQDLLRMYKDCRLSVRTNDDADDGTRKTEDEK
jgi:WD40 repeat protein